MIFFTFQFEQFFPEVKISLESDNYQGDFLTLIYRKDPDAALASSFASSWDGLDRPQFELESFPLPFDDVSLIENNPVFWQFLRSDHTSFWLSNISAIFITDSGMRKIL